MQGFDRLLIYREVLENAGLHPYEMHCGENLEDSQLLASFDSFRLFGQSVPLNPAPVWRELEAKSRAALERSKLIESAFDAL